MTNSITVNSPTTNSSNSTPSSSRPVLSRLHLKTEQARRKLHDFVLQAWPLLAIPCRYLVVCLRTRVVVRYTEKARGSEMRPNDGSLPGRRMAQERLDARRRALSEAPLPLKIVLVAAVLLLGVFAAPFLIVAAFIYAPVAVFAGHRSLVASLAVAVWGLAVVSGFSGGDRVAIAPLMLLPFAMVAGAHARPLSRQFAPCRTVVLGLLWALPPAMVAWHLLPKQPLVSIVVAWVLGGLVLAWRWA